MIVFGSLFSGIGGFDLGFERAGMRCAWQCEIDAAARGILTQQSGRPIIEDVRDVRSDNVAAVDLVCGGFPCQPHSLAGERAASEDERDLWPEFYRVIRELDPRWIVAENVYGLLSSESGRFFGGILRDLAVSGYHATWQVLSARAFGALHLRERVFLIANRDGERIKGFWQGPLPRIPEFSWCENVRRVEDLRSRSDLPVTLIRRKGNGVSRRVDMLGNAIVPGIAEWIGRRIIEMDGVACVPVPVQPAVPR